MQLCLVCILTGQMCSNRGNANPDEHFRSTKSEGFGGWVFYFSTPCNLPPNALPGESQTTILVEKIEKAGASRRPTFATAYLRLLGWTTRVRARVGLCEHLAPDNSGRHRNYRNTTAFSADRTGTVSVVVSVGFSFYFSTVRDAKLV